MKSKKKLKKFAGVFHWRKKEEPNEINPQNNLEYVHLDKSSPVEDKPQPVDEIFDK